MSTFYDFRIDVPPGASGNVATTCPQCSHERKKKHARCLSVNVDKGVWHCWHCHWTGSLRKRKDTPARLRAQATRAQLLHAAHVLICAADDPNVGLDWDDEDRETLRRSFRLLANNPPKPFPVPSVRVHHIPPDPLAVMRGQVARAMRRVRHYV